MSDMDDATTVRVWRKFNLPGVLTPPPEVIRRAIAVQITALAELWSGRPC